MKDFNNRIDKAADRYSPYRQFSTEEWAKLRQNTPLTLTESELANLRGVNERVSLAEVKQIYVPLSRLLSLYVSSVQKLNRGVQQFTGFNSAKVPFILGVAGSVAVGKSTVARILQTLLARWPEHPKVDLVSTDGFLLSTADLEARDLMGRKGFPESFDRDALLQFMSDVKGGRRHLRAPIYSHLHYDVLPDQFIEVDQPDILIVEGLNVLQTGKLADRERRVFVSDYFDFSIYIDAETEDLERWFIQRFISLRKTVFSQPDAYFKHFATLSEAEATETAKGFWNDINLINLYDNILPTRDRAKLILKKAGDHAIENVRLRKL
ncbi:MAG: type I pantothenate kinase [Granulosicoccus sp.]